MSSRKESITAGLVQLSDKPAELLAFVEYKWGLFRFHRKAQLEGAYHLAELQLTGQLAGVTARTTLPPDISNAGLTAQGVIALAVMVANQYDEKPEQLEPPTTPLPPDLQPPTKLDLVAFIYFWCTVNYEVPRSQALAAA